MDSRVRKLYEDNGGKVNATELEQVLKAPENQNNETKWQESVNQIAESLQTMGKPVFNLELKTMDGIATSVSKIEKLLIADAQERADEKEATELIESFDDSRDGHPFQ